MLVEPMNDHSFISDVPKPTKIAHSASLALEPNIWKTAITQTHSKN